MTSSLLELALLVQARLRLRPEEEPESFSSIGDNASGFLSNVQNLCHSGSHIMSTFRQRAFFKVWKQW
jgi:hypothetical protein